MKPPVQEKDEKFSVQWTGWLVPPATDTYFIGFIGDDGYRVYLDNTLLFENWNDHAEELSKVKIDSSKGKKYKVRVEYYQNQGGADR